LRERPDLSQELYSGRAVLGTIDTFLVHRLTDGAVFATDPTNASRTLLLDVHRLDWDDELCHLFGVPRPALADVRESATEFGTTDLAGQLPRRVPICGVMGDSQASLFAQRCYQPGEAKVTFGSGTSVLLNVGQEASTAGSGSVLALAWVLEGRPTYALEGLINYSSATIAWLRDQLGLIAEAAECESLATSVADNGGVFLVPAFAGLSAPHWRPDVRAAILGMTGHTHKAHIVRAALEAIAYQIKDVLDAMQQESGVTPRVVFADGGPTRNRFLMQFTADMLQRELIVADVAESSALGAALAGMMGLGIHPTLNSLAELPRETTPYRPARATREVTRLHSAWSEAVRRLL
jgi:glycerol kinase